GNASPLSERASSGSIARAGVMLVIRARREIIPPGREATRRREGRLRDPTTRQSGRQSAASAHTGAAPARRPLGSPPFGGRCPSLPPPHGRKALGRGRA